MDRDEAHRKVADRLAPYGTYINVGEKTPSGMRASLST